jgi:hypothetical protein
MIEKRRLPDSARMLRDPMNIVAGAAFESPDNLRQAFMLTELENPMKVIRHQYPGIVEGQIFLFHLRQYMHYWPTVAEIREQPNASLGIDGHVVVLPWQRDSSLAKITLTHDAR